MLHKLVKIISQLLLVFIIEYGGWLARLLLHVKADNDDYNTAAYELEEKEVEATAGGSLANLAGNPHNAQLARDLGNPILDVASSGDGYYWEGAGYVQWEIPYIITRK
ncbi:MAG: hypothetical protein GKR88_20110 [Flavobacteriaceae bacterium]|nr:MAG: hypothetical protein GKR88_20110 [Flavobacteriaceae bacterium]